MFSSEPVSYEVSRRRQLLLKVGLLSQLEDSGLRFLLLFSPVCLATVFLTFLEPDRSLAIYLWRLNLYYSIQAVLKTNN